MAIIKFQQFKSPIVFCCVDYTHTYTSSWTRELIKNISDYTISNIFSKRYDILQGQNEDALLQTALSEGYMFAVVFSTGTEFINGSSFYDAVENLSKTETFLAGHILDRGDAYYELHNQCYFVNLKLFNSVGQPRIGNQELGSKHQQISPQRSDNNWHDDYTPLAVSTGNDLKTYNHKCHGWNILQTAFDNNLQITVFDNKIRESKKHYYPENQQEFLKHMQWAYQKFNYCSSNFIHTENTESISVLLSSIEQIVTPASGIWWINCVSTSNPVTVVFYDYNQSALDYWKETAPLIKNVTYSFIKCDLLNQDIDLSFLDPSKPTVINLSNIFAYEGTSFFYSLEFRVFKENRIIEYLKLNFPDALINFSLRASTGFDNNVEFDTSSHIAMTSMTSIKKPTWHMGDWL